MNSLQHTLSRYWLIVLLVGLLPGRADPNMGFSQRQALGPIVGAIVDANRTRNPYPVQTSPEGKYGLTINLHTCVLDFYSADYHISAQVSYSAFDPEAHSRPTNTFRR